MKQGAIVLDCQNPDELADFYQRLLGPDWIKIRPDEEWVFIKSEKGDGLPLVFQQDPDYTPPAWPAKPGEQRQMMHLDFYVDEVAPAVEQAIACGARLAPTQLSDGWQVLLDPAGHPFCIIPNTPPDQG